MEQINRMGDKARAEVLEKEANKELDTSHPAPGMGTVLFTP
ncbi:MAG TPA: hypothetical protein VI585_16785 [Candidatus Binatia bacterium]